MGMNVDVKLKFWEFMEWFKDFVFRTVILILIIICIGMIFNGLGKIMEAMSPYEGKYYRAIEVNEGSSTFLNCYIAEENKNKTIVILSAHDQFSPVIRYKALADELSSDFRVVIVEDYGYGFSENTNDERTNEVIAKELNDVLNNMNVSTPYTLLANEESMLYAMKLQSMYPDRVVALVNVDGYIPSLIKGMEYQNLISKKVSNEKMTYYLEKTGIESVLSYFKPNEFGIDKIEAMADHYGEDEIAVYRNRIANNFLSKVKLKETQKLQDNMKELVDYQYPADVGVLSIASSGNTEYYNELKKQKVISEDYLTLVNKLVTNTGLHRVVSIEGDKGLEISNVTEEANQIKDYLREYYELKYGTFEEGIDYGGENNEENEENGENVEEEPQDNN